MQGVIQTEKTTAGSKDAQQPVKQHEGSEPGLAECWKLRLAQLPIKQKIGLLESCRTAHNKNSGKEGQAASVKHHCHLPKARKRDR